MVYSLISPKESDAKLTQILANVAQKINTLELDMKAFQTFSLWKPQDEASITKPTTNNLQLDMKKP